MFSKKILTLIFIITTTISFSQNHTLRGIIKDKETGQEVEGANLLIKEYNIYATSDKKGNFLLNDIPHKEISIIISHIGYKTEMIEQDFSQLNTHVIEVLMTKRPIDMGQITVSSTRYKIQEKDVAYPLEVVSSEEIIKYSPVTISEVLNNEAGVNLSRDGIWGTSATIRGLSKNNIITLVDGNRIETAANLAAGLSLFNVDDIERIEVVKGASSVLYGSGATGGIINIITKSPSFSDNFYLRGNFIGGFATVNNLSSSNLSLSSGYANWSLKLTGSIRTATNTMTPAGELLNSQFKDNNLNGAFDINIFKNHYIKLDYQRFEAIDVGIPGGKSFPINSSAKYPSELRELYSGEYEIKNLLPGMNSVSIKYFRQLIERRVENIVSPTVLLKTGADHTTDGLQFTTDWYLENRFRVISGIDFWQREYNGYRTRELKAQNRIIGDLPVPDSKFRSLGLFIQNDFNLTSTFSLSLGGRYDFINITSDGVNNPLYIINNGARNDNPPKNPQASFASTDVENKSWSLNLGSIYNLNDNTSISFNAARSFRSPTLEERFQYIDLGGNIYLGNTELEPEQGLFFDIGLRNYYENFSLRGNIFMNLLSNLVVDQSVIPDSLFIKSNVGKARLYGFDLTSEYNPLNKYVFYITLSYVRGEDTENKTNLPEIPPINSKIGIRSSVSDIINWEFVTTLYGDQNKTAFGEMETSGYVNFDLFLNSFPIDLGFLKVNLYGGIQNITNKEYRNHLSTIRGVMNFEPGRNFFIRAKVTW